MDEAVVQLVPSGYTWTDYCTTCSAYSQHVFHNPGQPCIYCLSCHPEAGVYVYISGD